ncbi:MAG: tetratricopeptide repeat protein [Pyrinomonadaceae bacterium]
MNDTKQIEALKSLADAAKERSRPGRTVCVASVRASPGAYLVVSSVLTFCAGLLLRSGRDGWALVAIVVAWTLLPALALTDKIAFDGQSLIRRGVVPLIFQLISGRRQQLSLAEVERVDTNAVRTLRRGGRVRYRYRSQITGRGIGFVFASGGRRYREMVQRLFPLIHDDKIDLRTRELRDYLCDPKSLNRELNSLKLAPSDVLDNATLEFRLGGKKEYAEEQGGCFEVSPGDFERAILLRQLGNKLRIAGRLREAGEAFRRALNVLPRDGQLIYDFARLLRSQASARGDARLLSRARAALRLSARRADEDANLLSLIGEGFLECNEAARAERSFQRAIELEPRTFRARLGLADVALRNGKLAHVIHQYRDAAHQASEKALIRYARREADYYVLLNDDDDYLSAELSRINWLQTLTRGRRLTARLTNASILVALIGTYADQAIAGIAWALASSSLVAWLASLLVGKALSARRKPRPVE